MGISEAARVRLRSAHLVLGLAILKRRRSVPTRSVNLHIEHQLPISAPVEKYAPEG